MSASAEPEFATTVAAAARAIGVHRHTLGSWIGSGLVRREPAGFHLPTLRRLAKDRLEARLRHREGDAATHWLGELRKVQAERLGLQNRQRAGRLVPHGWVHEQHRNRVALIGRDLRLMAERLVEEFRTGGVPEARLHVLVDELRLVGEHYGRALGDPPVPGPEIEEHEVEEDTDLLEHDDDRTTTHDP